MVVVVGTLTVALVLYAVRVILLRRIRHVTDRTRYTLDTVITQSLALPLSILNILGSVLACHWLLFYMEILSDKSPGLMHSLIQVLTVSAVLVFVDRLISGMVGGYSEKFDSLRTSRSLIQVITRGLIITLGLLIILGTLGVSITPLIASLGITSLVVALALQPTLENVFSGIQLVTGKPIRVGDFIELESGDRGLLKRLVGVLRGCGCYRTTPSFCQTAFWRSLK